MSGLPIRLRLTLVFAAAMGLLLAGAGVFLYLRLDSTLDDSQEAEALESLLAALLVGGTVVLALAALAAYRLAAAALRPVEAMRVEAEAISASEPGRRLPLPPADDEIRRLGETLNAMLGRLEAALERERAFVADASHELRTPLTNLRAELELALRRPRTAEELEQALRSAAAEADRLSRLADGLLLLARTDEGGLPLHRQEIGARDLFERVRARFATPDARPIETDPADGLVLDGDSLRLEQALGNLVANALVHGAGTVRLTAESTAEGLVELHVLDEGPGFPPAFLPDAFDRFSHADESRATGGAGLGLAIVAAVAKAHGGSVGAENRPCGGADVWLAVPRSRRP